ncbi:MAG: M23 family metallopeptidase [Hyphomicrobiales bacterium]|nr:M23 family metallopeptidase [Hyphomicrobiales bacterium]MCP5371122.1 M23 family metallopeptidase [Hyphomicrobiales bacterium]
MRAGLLALVLWAWSLPAAAEWGLADRYPQGALAVGQAAPGSTVRVDGRPVRVSPGGLFLVGLGRDAEGPVSVAVRAPDGTETTRRLTVTTREYRIQRIDGLPPKKVTPPPETLARIRAESARIKAVRGVDSDRAGFAGGFVWPVAGTVSGVFGSQRILNGKPRSPHRGVDIAAPAGTPVRAAADGVVALAAPDMYYTGKTVMVDHGHGLTSVYAHMRDLRVAEGQVVERGAVIGTVGQSGRATGPHLHWGISLFATALDPALVAGPPPAAQ